MTTSTMPIDELIQRIRDKAAWDAPAAQGIQESFIEKGFKSLPVSDHAEAKIRERSKNLHVRHFFISRNHEEFVQNAYRILLNRPADPGGLLSYCDRLKQGSSRFGILVRLATSQEGRLVAVQVNGLGFLRVAHAVERIMWAIGLNQLAKAIAGWVDSWFSVDAEDFHACKTSDLALLRLLESWRTPIESQIGRTVIIERELISMQRVIDEQSKLIDLMRSQINVLLQKESFALNNTAHSSDTSIGLMESAQDPALNDYYLVFEDANRGTQQEFIDKIQVYADLFTQLKLPGCLPLLDIGCGRGELLDYLKDLGVAVSGVDMNGTMVRSCQARGLEVVHSDALSYLRSLEDNSLGCVTGFHIIEHLPFHELFYIMQECFRVLSPDGFVLFETPNPENVLVGSHTFYHDFTHRNPITPTAIQFLARYHGFNVTDIVRCNPYPENARVPGDDPITERVNGHFCGPQDFALIARKSDTKDLREAR